MRLLEFTYANESKVGLAWDSQSELYNLRKKFSYTEKAWTMFMGRARVHENTFSIIGTASFGFGLLPQVIEWCQESGIEYALDKTLSERMRKREPDIGGCLGFFRGFQFFSKDTQIFPRKDQLGAVIRAISNDRVVNVCPTSFGKSLCIFMQMLHNFHVRGDKRNIIIVPTIALVDQFEADIKDYCTNGPETMPWFPKIQTLSSGKPKALAKDTQVFITTWQSLKIILEGDRDFINDNFEHVILDEAHKGAAKCLKQIFNLSTDVRYRTGWTGTLNEHTIQKLVVESLVGRSKNIIMTSELMRDGIVANLEIVIYHFKHPKRVHGFQEAKKAVTSSKERTSFLVDIIERESGKTGLLLFQFLPHGSAIYKECRKRFPDKKVFLIDGGQILFNGKKYKTFQELKNLIENYDDNILVCSYGVFSTGISLKNIHWLIFGYPMRSYIRTIQSIGRSLRVSESKQAATLYDIVDHLVGSRAFYSQAEDRKKFYLEEKFDIREELGAR
jgi:superfamily II DNA or RNA helicase